MVASSFKGTLALVSNKSTPSESVASLLNTISNQVACQQQLQTDRLLIYRILEATSSQHLDGKLFLYNDTEGIIKQLNFQWLILWELTLFME